MDHPGAMYLGCSQTNWLDEEPPAGHQQAPLFVALHRMRRYLRADIYPRARMPWALDSGGFNHVRKNGGWVLDPVDYVHMIRTFDHEIGNLDWAAPMDWMCEPDALAATGLTVADHIRLTVDNYAQLWRLWWEEEERQEAMWEHEALPVVPAPDCCPIMPVLQGITEDDYLRCGELYERAGFNLAEHPVVGLGSVCRRQATKEVERIIERLRAEFGCALHGFGVKSDGLARYGHLLESADSHAWSVAARREETTCRHGLVRWERNCKAYAHEWRARVVDGMATEDNTAEQLTVFGALAGAA